MSFASKILWSAAILGTLAWIDHAGDGQVASADAAPIPADYKGFYQASAGTCPHLDWALLAGVGKVETDHGRTSLPGARSGFNSAGAGGPMQFLPATFTAMRRRHPDIGPDQWDPATSIRAAAHYLCDSGVASGDVSGALYTYNHSYRYVADVTAVASDYRRTQH